MKKLKRCNKSKFAITGIASIFAVLIYYRLYIHNDEGIIVRPVQRSSVLATQSIPDKSVEVSLYTDNSYYSAENDPITKLSQSTNQARRERFQKRRVQAFCSEHKRQGRKFTFPSNTEQKQLLLQHLILNDEHQMIFCFVDESGGYDIKEILTNSSMSSIQSPTDFSNKMLNNVSRRRRLKEYRKLAMIRNPLERLVAAYQKFIEPSITSIADEFPVSLQIQILNMYHPEMYKDWMKEEMSYPLYINFTEFVTYLVEANTADVSSHFQPMIDICHPCRIQYDFFGNYKRYYIDSNIILDKMYPIMRRTSNYRLIEKDTLVQYYSQLPQELKHRLYYKWYIDLDFYHHLYPEEKHSNDKLLDNHDKTKIHL